MYWNYRVIRKEKKLAIYSVYYDENGKIKGLSEEPFSPEGESLEDLKTDLELMLESLSKEIIDFDASSQQ